MAPLSLPEVALSRGRTRVALFFWKLCFSELGSQFNDTQAPRPPEKFGNAEDNTKACSAMTCGQSFKVLVLLVVRDATVEPIGMHEVAHRHTVPR